MNKKKVLIVDDEADEYVTKPFDMDMLIALVKKYLNKDHL